MRNRTKHYDAFFKTVFRSTERTASLLNVAAKRNKGLAEFLGAADLAFQVNLKKSRQRANLLIGVVLEHKSYVDYNLLDQLQHYYFEVMRPRLVKEPVVAIVIYNGRDAWNPSRLQPYPDYPEYFRDIGLPFKLEFVNVGVEIKSEDIWNLEPSLALALVAMRYVFAAEENAALFNECTRRFLALKTEDAIN